MDNIKFDNILGQLPLVITDGQGKKTTFTSLPSYEDIAQLCKNNPAFTTHDEIFGCIVINDHLLMDDIHNYQITYAQNPSIYNDSFMNALDDIVNTMQSYYATECVNFAEGVIAQCDGDEETLLRILDGLQSLIEDAHIDNDNSAAALNSKIALHIAEFCNIEISENIEDSTPATAAPQNSKDDYTNLSQKFNDIIRNIGPNESFLTTQMQIGEELCTVPLNKAGAQTLARAFALDAYPLSYIIESALDKDLGVPMLADEMLEDAILEFEEGVELSAEEQEAKQAMIDMLTHIRSEYKVQISGLVSAYFESTNDAQADIAALDKRMEQLLTEKSEDGFFAGARLLQNISKAMTSFLEDRKAEMDAFKAVGANASEKSTFLAPTITLKPKLH